MPAVHAARRGKQSPCRPLPVQVDGELYVAGSNDSSQLGVRQQDSVQEPTRVQGLESRQVEQVRACWRKRMLHALSRALLKGGLHTGICRRRCRWMQGLQPCTRAARQRLQQRQSCCSCIQPPPHPIASLAGGVWRPAYLGTHR